MLKSVMSQTKVPSDKAVNNTPKVEREIPCHNTGFTDFQLVSSPPENRIKFRDTIPMTCAMEGSSNSIPPMPSDPARIPTERKSIRVGTPNLYEVFPAKILISNRIEPTNSIFPGVNSIRLSEYLLGT